MADVVAGDGTLRLDGSLPAGAFAYVDVDWARDRVGAVPSLVVDGPEPDAVAARALEDMAAAVAALLGGREPGAVEVGGDGAVARLVRNRTGAPAQANDVPGVVVDTSGTAASVSRALGRVADLGLVVVAAAVSGPLQLSLYADLHVRGLELICIAPTVGRAAPAETDAELTQTLSVVPASGQLDPGAAWYRVGA